MRVRADKRAAVAALVADISADARLTEKGSEHLSFSLPQSSLDLPSLFAEVRTAGRTAVVPQTERAPLSATR